MKKRLLSMMMAIALFTISAMPVFAVEKGIRTKLVTVADTVNYLVVDVKDFGKKPSRILLDNKESDFTDVNDEGTVVKREFDGIHKYIKIIFQDGSTHSSSLANTYKGFSPRSSNSGNNAPDLVWGHGIMAVWDFHTVAKNSSGKELKYPEKTTFATTGEILAPVASNGSANWNNIVTNSPNPSEVVADTVYDYRSDVLYRYDLSNDREKDRFNRLDSAVKVQSDGSEELITMEKSIKGNVGYGKIIYGTSSPIQSTGIHRIKLIYKGLNPEEKTIQYKDKAPTIYFNGDSGEYVTGKSLLFTLKGFEYIWQHDMGVDQVYLNGKELVRREVILDKDEYKKRKNNGDDVLENESGNPWHVINELIRIKNHGIKELKEGINYLTVKYRGYKDSNLVFYLNKGLTPTKKDNDKKRSTSALSRAKRAGVMAISGASGGGASKPSIGGEGNSINMGVKIVFDFNMVANAKILESMGYKIEQAKKLLDTWEGVSKEVAISKSRPERKVVWDAYLTFVQRNLIDENRYMSFASYSENPAVETTKNIPYQIKFAIGNKVGLPMFNISEILNSKDKEGSSLKVSSKIKEVFDVIKVGQSIELPMDSWTNNIERISIDGTVLEKNIDYTYDTSNNLFKLTNRFFSKPGKIEVVIDAKGYEQFRASAVINNINKSVVISFRNDAYKNGKVLVGEPLKFHLDDSRDVVESVRMITNGTEIELKKGKDYTYYRGLGFIEVNKSLVTKEGEYTVEFMVAGKHPTAIKVDVIKEYPTNPSVGGTVFYDEKEMDKKFPGMVYDIKNNQLKNDGSFKGYADFIDNIEKVEINGHRLSFGTTGVLVSNFEKGNERITFFKRPVSGDVITVHSKGFESLHYKLK